MSVTVAAERTQMGAVVLAQGARSPLDWAEGWVRRRVQRPCSPTQLSVVVSAGGRGARLNRLRRQLAEERHGEAGQVMATLAIDTDAGELAPFPPSAQHQLGQRVSAVDLAARLDLPGYRHIAERAWGYLLRKSGRLTNRGSNQVGQAALALALSEIGPLYEAVVAAVKELDKVRARSTAAVAAEQIVFVTGTPNGAVGHGLLSLLAGLVRLALQDTHAEPRTTVVKVPLWMAGFPVPNVTGAAAAEFGQAMESVIESAQGWEAPFGMNRLTRRGDHAAADYEVILPGRAFGQDEDAYLRHAAGVLEMLCTTLGSRLFARHWRNE